MAESWRQTKAAARNVSYQLEWGTMRGLAWGDATAKPLLCVHGWLDNAHSFLPLAEAFLASDLVKTHQLIALDWAGHGLSDKRPKGSFYPFIEYVYDLWSLTRQQDWQQLEIIAHSMGAFVANIFAAVDPERVTRLLAIEAFGLLSQSPEQTQATMRKGFLSRDAQLQKRRPHYPTVAAGIQARAKAGDFSEQIAAQLVDRGIEKLAEHDYRFRADGLLRVASPTRLTDAQVADLLQAIEAQFTLVLGTSGHQELRQAVAQWGHLVPQLQQVDINGGHHVHMEQPDAIIALFLRMINT